MRSGRRSLTVVSACALAVAMLAVAACGGASSPPLSASAVAKAIDGPAAAPARRHHALKMIWGPNTMPDGRSAFPVYKKLGVDVLELQISWRATATARPANPRNPGDPAYRWPAAVDVAVAQALAAGIGIGLMVRGTPDWANGNRGEAQVPDRDADYADFLRAAARRYPSVRHWMIWGEPTRIGNFTPMPEDSKVGPRRYATLLDTAYGALKAQNRRNVVIGGMTWTLGIVTPSAFVKWMRLPNGKPPRMDMYGHNPFSTRFPNIKQPPYYPGLRDISDVDTLYAELKKAYPRRTPPLWLSEFTIASDRPNRGFAFSVSRAQQARWVTAAYQLADRAPYVAGLGWFNLFDEGGSDPRSLTNGLMDANGDAKPAFTAYRKAP